MSAKRRAWMHTGCNTGFQLSLRDFCSTDVMGKTKYFYNMTCIIRLENQKHIEIGHEETIRQLPRMTS